MHRNTRHTTLARAAVVALVASLRRQGYTNVRDISEVTGEADVLAERNGLVHWFECKATGRNYLFGYAPTTQLRAALREGANYHWAFARELAGGAFAFDVKTTDEVLGALDLPPRKLAVRFRWTGAGFTPRPRRTRRHVTRAELRALLAREEREERRREVGPGNVDTGADTLRPDDDNDHPDDHTDGPAGDARVDA